MNNMNMAHLVSTRLLFASLLTIPAFAQITAGARSAIDQAVTKEIAKAGIASASIAVVQEGKLAYAQAYGFSNLELKKHATTSMRYKIGSNSKQLTATAILLLSDEGKISLDDPVARFFPELTRAKDITIRQLLSHTSGYEDYYALDYVAPYMALPTTPLKIIGIWGRKPLNFEPGTQWQYSNTNYTIAGAIAEKLAGQPLIDFLHARVFKTLGMKSPIDVDKQPWSKEDAVGYTRFALGPPRVAQPEGSAWISSAGELAMTPADMALWDISLMNGTVLKPALLKQLTTEIHLKNGVGTTYALGLGIRNSNGHRIWSHGGGTSGFISSNTTYPDDRLAITVFTNQDDPAAHAIARDIEHILKSPAADPDASKDLTLVETVYRQLSEGKLDRSLLTSDANAYFTAQAIADYAASLQALGAPSDFKETSATKRGGMSHRFYQLQTKSKSLTISTFITSDGKLDEFLVYPAPQP